MVFKNRVKNIQTTGYNGPAYSIRKTHAMVMKYDKLENVQPVKHDSIFPI